MEKNQIITFKKQKKNKAITISCLLFFIAFPLLYLGIINNSYILMLGALTLVSVGVALNIILG